MKRLLCSFLITGGFIMFLAAQNDDKMVLENKKPVSTITDGGNQTAEAAPLPLTRRPAFPGGQEALDVYIENNLKYPKTAVDNNFEGEVLVYFKVDQLGNISEVKILEGICNACDQEVIRIIEAMPNWKPALQYGMAVPNPVTLTVRFSMI